MPDLLINIDHVATLRNARREAFPDPVHAAVLCELAGADGIVFHLREDRRHIGDRDVRLLRETVKTKLDFELSTNEEIVRFCCETRPELATIVPENRNEVTTEGGIDVLHHRDRLVEITERLYAAGVQEVAYFIDPVIEQVEASADAGANCIEFHTGEFANAKTPAEQAEQVGRLARGAERAHELGLQIHAGHGLDYQNYGVFARNVSHFHEVSIGFAIIARALLVGMEQAVREMRVLVKGY